MKKKQDHNYQHHCEAFDNGLLSALTELVGATKIKHSERITNEQNNSNNDNNDKNNINNSGNNK